jgi:hypothetical protein
VVAGVPPANKERRFPNRRFHQCSRHGCHYRETGVRNYRQRRTDFIFLWWHACRVQFSPSRRSRHGCRYTSTSARGLCRVPFHAGGVAPKVFETVKGAFGLMEDMDNYLEIIEHDPLAGRKSVDGGRANAVILF